MSYIGNAPPKLAQYGVESFNGGGTSFTLSKPATTTTVLVFIDGVRQTPGDAYSVSGTTLTTTATTPSGTDNVTVQFLGDVVDFGEPSDDSVTSAKIVDNAVGNSEMADDAVGIAELSATGTASSSTYLRGDNSWASISEYDDSGVQNDIAILGFKVAANGSLGKYDLVDQTIDDFQDASGIDASTSTNEVRNASNYYSGVSVGSYTTDAFTSTGASTWTCPADTQEAEVLIVGGGGGGGNHYYGGGGGAGGVVHDTDYAVVAGTVYDITVGAGGSAATSGSDSVWNVNAEGSGITMTADGGGRGGDSSTQNGVSGGSGGGASGYGVPNTGGSSSQTSPTGATGYGNAGGGGSNQGGSGGGGANAVGQDAPGTNNEDGGYGGAGKLFSNFTAYGTTSGNVASSGSDGGYFGGGGGGGGYPGDNSNQGGAGGVGGGGKGAKSYDTGSTYQAVAGMANTGGGGGGGSGSSSFNGKAGGSGVVLIRHRTEAYNNMTLISNATTAEATATSGDIVLTYTNGAGTATVNTDLKAYVSRDNGTTWTQATLSSEGTTGGHTILTSHNVDISSQPSGTSMRYKIETLNQSASKETRIQAVSLGWS